MLRNKYLDIFQLLESEARNNDRDFGTGIPLLLVGATQLSCCLLWRPKMAMLLRKLQRNKTLRDTNLDFGESEQKVRERHHQIRAEN